MRPASRRVPDPGSSSTTWTPPATRARLSVCGTLAICHPPNTVFVWLYDPDARMRGTTRRSGLAIARISPRAAMRMPRSTSSHRLKHFFALSPKDVEVVATIHADLTEQGLKPKQHYVDAAYLSADLLVSTAEKVAIELIGPVTKLQNVSWQAKEQTGYDTAQFQIDWAAKQATCPQGQTSVKWYDNVPDRTGNRGYSDQLPGRRLSGVCDTFRLHAERQGRAHDPCAAAGAIRSLTTSPQRADHGSLCPKVPDQIGYRRHDLTSRARL